jgi:pectate lyase
MCRTLLTGIAVAVLIVAQSDSLAARITAFPTAEGFGASTTGGRGGDVCYVTNLADHGSGSLREAVQVGHRTVLFKVSGTIDLDSKLDIKVSNITIAGQTAPGGGICLRGKPMIISGEHVIVRFLRLRPGDEEGQEHDSLTIWGANHVMVDHCSMSWSTDSVNDVVRDSENVTVQWCIVSEPLNQSVHQKGAHGYGTGWGSGPASGNSFHHNLLAHCNSRSPRIGSERRALVDVRNNVVYNMGTGWAYGGERARINYVANYYKPGPDTSRPRSIFRVSNHGTRMYLVDNQVEGASLVSKDNRRGVIFDDGIDPTAILVPQPFEVPAVETQSADDAYELVLRHAGAVLPARDAVDERVISDVRTGSGRVINSQADVGGWPDLASPPPPNDSDSDGIPDQWEREHGTDPSDGQDGAVRQVIGWTNLEHYLNWLASAAMPEAYVPPLRRTESVE